MDRCIVLVVIGSVLLGLPTVLGQLKKCTSREKCTAIGDCPAFEKYIGTPYSTWPEKVLNEARTMYCGSEQRGSNKVG